jgi:hypoxanthine phosphoribosyltransferase
MSGKKQMSYNEFKTICLDIAEKYKDQNIDEIVAVTRGGLSAAHIIAKKLRKQVGFYFPSKGLYVPFGEPKKVLIIEDLVAKGRTWENIKINFPTDIEYSFCAVLIDSNYDNKDNLDYGIKSSEWIVFPYEEFEESTEGDRGLFRDGSGLY